MCGTAKILIILFFGVSMCQADCHASSGYNLTFYMGSLDNFTSVDIKNGTQIQPLLNKNLPTCIYIFGINSDAESAADVIQALLDTEEYNVVLVDWSKGGDNVLFLIPLSYVLVNVPSAEKVGCLVTEFLLKLIENGMDVSSFLLVGHSMGGQIAGDIGRRMKENGYNITKIMALDPAGPLFETFLPLHKTVDSSCADHVDIVHTDPNFLSYPEATGHVDYYPNYNLFHTTQPGCSFQSSDLLNATEFSDNISCNHGYAVKLFCAFLAYPDLLVAEHAVTGRAWLRGKGNSSDISTIRLEETPGAYGSYYLRTVETYPYGLGRAGISPS